MIRALGVLVGLAILSGCTIREVADAVPGIDSSESEAYDRAAVLVKDGTPPEWSLHDARSQVGSSDEPAMEKMRRKVILAGYRGKDVEEQARIEFKMRYGREPYGSVCHKSRLILE